MPAHHGVDVALTVPSTDELDEALNGVVADRVASRIAAQDPTLWGPDAESEASIRLSWTQLAESSRPLVAEIEALRAELHDQGIDHVVLCGMGGSSLAPEVICHTAGVDLTVLDSSQPDMVRSALADRLDRTVVVVSSKSGGTVETDSQRRAYEQAFTEAGIDPVQRIVVVTDPGSPLDEQASEAGYRVFRADPHVGGRYSALTAFGLVPSGLAGADIGELLDSAEQAQAALFADDVDNPALRLGVLLGVANRHGVDKLVLADRSGHGIGDWIEQLVAESTGKQGRGILPVVVPDEDAPNFVPSTTDSIITVIGQSQVGVIERTARLAGNLAHATLAATLGDNPPVDDSAVPTALSGYAAVVDGPLGAQMLLWEVAVAVAGRLIGIDPFDQPDVESAKKAARELLDGAGDVPTPDFSEDGIDVYGAGSSLADALDRLLDQIDVERGYLAVQVYLDRIAHADFAEVRETLAEQLTRPVTFGWGPRFLHSTGQFHKGGTPTGVFLQITGTPHDDLAISGRDFTFGSFIDSQAAGDAAVLRDHGRPVLRLHLTDVEAGLARIRELLA
ncbi:glucose-6-phosphate isomerase [Aeromicrobium fastidiosum]|uniref:Glucose-6-phosphate isomerase n=1 Tax=Aeromicrobium fastidiosum TaxID=52699 RepID=A0A641AJZ5_9ACTN|nr:glucose-6-phosphate isomerase [Aeromicrobium fastidiosum]KAA1376000.1 glucose-6-phosphate isomerase [Aeromicrobium fastidiosum]MBP2392138.1 glucose-6-phosphate isomerase [Aeromicrobium fastidiosum]